MGNGLEQERVENKWASERARDVRQDRDITSLFSAVRDFKDKLFQVNIIPPPKMPTSHPETYMRMRDV